MVNSIQLPQLSLMSLCQVLFMSPDLLVGLAADSENLFSLELQLSGEGADGLIEGVDLVVQV